MPQLPEPSLLLIAQLHHLQAMLSLGAIPNPATGEPGPVDLERARLELALLRILKEKTEGNLTEDEEGILDGAIITIAEVIESM